MRTCRLIFRKDIGQLLVRVVYSDEHRLPTLEEEKETFASLNGYNLDALAAFDVQETDAEFENLTVATNIRLENDSILYDIPESETINVQKGKLTQLAEKVDLLIMMQLEKEGVL